MEFYESPDGIGRAVRKITQLGTTYVDLVGDGFRGSYPLSTLAILEDHSEEFLSRLPEQGANLPYDPSPRYTNPGEATIEPDHSLPANLNPTNSVQNVNRPDSNIMDPFPTDTHRLVTPYHSSSFASALQSLGDAEVNPQEHNDSLESIEDDSGYSGEDHSTHTPFSDDPFVDGHFDDEMSDPTTEEWGVPAVQTFPAHGASVDFRGGRPAPRVHFAESLEGDVAEGEFVDDSGEDAEGAWSDHEAAWENQSPKWDELPSSSTLDNPFSTNNWDDRTMAPGKSKEDGAQIDPHGAGDSGGTESGETHDESQDGPWEPMEYNPHLKDSTFDFLGDYKYVKPSGNGKYKIVQKGTGKTLSEHDSKEEAEAAFRAMEQSMHSSSTMQRFMKHVKISSDSECWEWIGSSYNTGYARFNSGGSGKSRLAHRVSYELHNGEIPDGLVVAHACDNTRCVNPSHLFAVTHANNTEDMVAKGRHYNQQKTYCVNRHEFTKENTYLRPKGGRDCRICRATRDGQRNMHGGSVQGAVKQSPQGWFYIGPGGHTEGPFPTSAGAETAERLAQEADNGNEEQKIGDTPSPEKIASFDEEEIPRYWRQYFAFLDKDAEAREAAWADVRAKGQRLAREGHVHVDKYTSFRTDAQVQGDSGEYNVTIYRTAGWSKGVAHYICSCEWGKWAWRRHFYYGRFCSHGYATYLENQKLDSRRRNGPLDENVSVGLLSTGAAWDNWNNGDQVRLTDHHDASEVDGGHTVSVIPGDTGEIISIPYEDSAEVRMHHGDHGDSDLNIPFDKLEKIGFSVTSLETHDDDSGNEDWGSEAFSQDYAGDTGDGGGGTYSDDDQDSGIPDGVTASTVEATPKTTLDPDQWDPQHDKDIHVFSDDLDGVEAPHVPEGDHLRSMTKFNDPHFADATDSDEMDNPSTTDQQLSSPETASGGEDFGNVESSDQSRAAALDWLREDSAPTGFSGGDLVDPVLAAKLSGMDSGPKKITKSSAKIYTPMEQFALVEEEGRSELVDHLNLANSFYEM